MILNDPGPRPVSGHDAEASWLERFRRFVLAQVLLPGVGYRLRRYSTGVQLELEARSGGGGSTAPRPEYALVSVYGDYVAGVAGAQGVAEFIAGGLATVTTGEAHGLQTGDTATIGGASPPDLNGAQTVTVTSPTTFTYATGEAGPALGDIFWAEGPPVLVAKQFKHRCSRMGEIWSDGTVAEFSYAAGAPYDPTLVSGVALSGNVQRTNTPTTGPGGTGAAVVPAQLEAVYPEWLAGDLFSAAEVASEVVVADQPLGLVMECEARNWAEITG
jgi:hypothetical protein